MRRLHLRPLRQCSGHPRASWSRLLNDRCLIKYETLHRLLLQSGLRGRLLICHVAVVDGLLDLHRQQLLLGNGLHRLGSVDGATVGAALGLEFVDVDSLNDLLVSDFLLL